VSKQATRSKGGPSGRPAGRSSGPSGLSGRVLVFGGLAIVVVVAVIIALVSSGGDDGSSAGTGEQETAEVEVQGESLPPYDSSARTDDAIGDTVPTIDGEDWMNCRMSCSVGNC